MEKWVIESSEYLVVDQWIRLRADRCRAPDGSVIAPYYVLEYGDWLNVVPFLDDSTLLMIRHYRHGSQRWTLEFPGGFLEEGETDREAAAVRELEEETGYTARNLDPLPAISPNPATHTNKVYAFISRDVQKRGQQELDPAELITVAEVGIDEVKAAIQRGEVPGFHIAIFYMALHSVGCAS